MTARRGPMIVAELSANHNGSLDRAMRTIEAVAAAGAHAVKFQTWTPGTMVLDRAYKITGGPWDGRCLAELYDQAATPLEWHALLFSKAKECGLEAFSSVFDLEALGYLEALRCPRYKVASFELVDLPLIEAIARTGKPMILSTGMATEAEIREAFETARAAGAKRITLLQCTSAYPAPPEAANLRQMAVMANRYYPARAGLSDHTQGIGVAILAAAMGATMIEKHVALDDAPGLDAAFSIKPAELATLVREAPRAYAAYHGAEIQAAAEEPQRALRRSLYFRVDLRAGDLIGRQHVTTARPALGMLPRHIDKVVGRRLLMDVKAGEPVTREAIAERQPTVTA